MKMREIRVWRPKSRHIRTDAAQWPASHRSAPSTPSHRLGQGLRFMAKVAQTLRVVVVIAATLGEWHDVITLSGEHHQADCLAMDTQRRMRKERGPHSLEAPACDPLRRLRALDPCITLVLSTTPTAHCERSTAGEVAGTRSSRGHDSHAEPIQKQESPPLRRARSLSLTGTAASVMDGRPLCQCSVVAWILDDSFRNMQQKLQHIKPGD